MTLPVLNPDRLTIAIDGNQAVLRELIQLFKNSGAHSYQQLSHSAQQQDLELWRAACHELKGAAANLGLEQLHDLLTKALELPIAQATALLPKIHSAIHNANTALAEMLG